MPASLVASDLSARLLPDLSSPILLPSEHIDRSGRPLNPHQLGFRLPRPTGRWLQSTKVCSVCSVLRISVSATKYDVLMSDNPSVFAALMGEHQYSRGIEYAVNRLPNKSGGKGLCLLH